VIPYDKRSHERTRGLLTYMLYTINNDLSRLSQSTVRQVSQSYTQRLTPGTTTVSLCTVHLAISTGWQVANDIAWPQVSINSNNLSIDCSLQKTATGNGNLQPEIEINEYSSSKKLLE